MEKIVTKIGDVTIERRVSKPQQPKGPMDPPAGGNQNPPVQKIIPAKNKTEEQTKILPQSLGKLEPTSNKNLPNPVMKMVQKPFQQSGNTDLKTNNSPLKSLTGNPIEFPTNFTKPETSKSQDPAQKSELSLQSLLNSKSELSEDNFSLQKNDNSQQPKLLFPIKTNPNLLKSISNEPDFSKYAGISIERKKRVDGESQSSKPSELLPESLLLNPGVSIKKIGPQINLPGNMNITNEDFTDEEIDDSFDEDDFDDENIPFDDDVDLPVDFKEPLPPPLKTFKEEVEKRESDASVLETKNIVKEEEPKEAQVKEEKEEVDEQNTQELQMQIKEEVEDSSEKEPNINDLACTDLVELMQKGEIEGEIEEVKDDEMIDEAEKKKDGKRKADGDGDDDGGEGDEEKELNSKPVKKKKKTEKKDNVGDEEDDEDDDEDDVDDEEDEDEDDEKEENKDQNIDKSKITNANLRKNIREVMDETKLDEATLAAQRQEAERLKRLQEQQRIIREVQRQIALNRQNQKSQNKVLSLLQGNSQTSILKTSSTTAAQSGQAKNQNSVLVKLSNGEQTSLNNKKMIELLKNSKNKTIAGKPPIPKTLLKQGMVTPSVTIAPVVKKEPVVDPKKKKKDVVTLSSDSEDDCIVLSDEDESEPEEDPTNSGMHTNDKYNLPDEKGRVIVNVGHPESESDLYLAPQIAKIIKPHQIGGIRFLYDNVIESVDRFGSSAGFGCILAHSMGLGKTLQIVSFSDIFLRYTSAKTILCIMPINTIQNWLAEFNMWLPKESTSEEIRCREFDLFIVNESLKNITSRAKVILEWYKSGGVLLMGYELFRLLSLKKTYKSKKKRKKAIEEDDARNKELVEEVYSALVRPGPDLVICDEGHRIKNSHATTSQALKQIRTKRRIVLTGYPLQNNLLEYWCMVDFVRPNYLGSKTEFSNMFERPIQNGQCIDSTPQDKRLMRYRAHVLHSLLEGFVQRRSHAVLQSTLPEKEEYVLLLRFTPFQRKLYDTFMNEVVRTVAVPNPLKAFAVCCKIWNHPDVLYNFLKKKGEEIDLDLEEALPPSLQPPQFPYGQQTVGPDGITPQSQLPVTIWPKRGPGSRGGKVRQSTKRGLGRGRKPAATISPNMIGSEKVGGNGMSFGSSQFPSNENFSNHQENLEGFQNSNYNQGQFGFGNNYGNQSSYPNPSFNKTNSLNNVDEISSNNFQNKRFFPQQNEQRGQGQYASQNFDSGQQEGSFNPNSSNDSNLNASFDSNLNSSDSNFNQGDTGKSFDFTQEFNSEFFSNNNFQNPGSNAGYSSENKNSSFQGNQPFFSESSFRNTDNFDFQSTGNNLSFSSYERANTNFQSSSSNPNFSSSNSSFQNSNRSDSFGANSDQRVNGTAIGQVTNFQSTTPVSSFQDSNSSSASNFSTAFQGSDSNFDPNRSNNFISQNPNSNFQGNNPTFDTTRSGNFQDQSTGTTYQGQGNSSNFQNQSTATSFKRQTGSNFQNQAIGSNFQGEATASNFQSQSGTNFQGQVTTNFKNQTTNSNFQGSNPSSNFQNQVTCSNFQGPPSSDFKSQTAAPNFQGETTDSNFQTQSPNTNFRNQVASSNFQGQPNSNFKAQTTGANFQDTSCTSNFQGQTTTSNFKSSNFQRDSTNTNFQGQPNSNFKTQTTGSNFQPETTRSSNFQGQTTSPNFKTSSPNFQRDSTNSSFRGQTTGSNFSSQTPSSNFQGQTTGQNFQEENAGQHFQGQATGRNFQRQTSSNFQGQTNNSNFQSQSSGSNFQNQTSSSSFQGNQYPQGFWPQSNWSYPESSKANADFPNNNGATDFLSQKFESFDPNKETKTETKPFSSNNDNTMYDKIDCNYQNFGKNEDDVKFPEFEENKSNKPKEEEEEKKEEMKNSESVKKDDASLPYDWATDLFKTYVTGVIENSSKMEVFFHIVTESIKLGDRLLVFSQSLLTLDLIEDYLHRQNVPDKEEVWAKNKNYFRLDGSTPGLEREKLINEFNSNPNIYLFLVSTRAGSLGINLVGANRVVVFDASWNPCHDTQAVCRVYRYGQRKPCFVYRLVMDSCLEKKIYDRQVNKQGMADRVVDELNPDAHLSIKEVTNLCWDDQEDTTVKDFSHLKDKFKDEIIKMLLDRCSNLLSKEPFQHESLLIDRKEKKLSQAEKRLAKRSYELEKQAANQPKNIYSFFPNSGQRNFGKPIASVRPMQSEMANRMNPQLQNRSKWIPAEVWQKQGMSAQEMTLPLDVVIPTSSPEKTQIVLKAGQRVMVLKSPKGIYMQLENGKIIAIRSAFKVGQNGPGTAKHEESKKEGNVPMTSNLKTTPNLGMSLKMSQSAVRPGMMKQPFLKPFTKVPDKKMPVNMNLARPRQITGKAKPFILNRKFETVMPDVKQRLLSGKMGFSNSQEENKFSSDQSGSEDGISVEERPEAPSTNESSFSDEKESIIDSPDEKTDEKPEEKQELADSLETLRKVTERISDDTKKEEVDDENKFSPVNSLKNYRHNFTSQINGKPPVVSEKKEGEEEGGERKTEGSNIAQQQGNENMQNWMMNQAYPPMDPYGNYFPGYYGYGPGPGPMMPPYDGFYPPSNYGHPMGQSSSMVPPPGKQQHQPQPPPLPQQQVQQQTSTETQKPTSQAAQPSQPLHAPMVQGIQNSSGPRYPPAVNTPPMYPPYPNPYPYPYNYPANPNFNNQGFPFGNQNQSTHQAPAQNVPPTGNINHPSTPNQPNQPNQPTSYDNSMYSAFHRPDAPFQAPENPYPAPYPRPPYPPNSATPGFFPYNPPYNYPYGHNFNPYMHPAGYGYPMQNPPPINNQSQNPNLENNPGNSGNNSSGNTNSNNS